jgi:four helix bundle protein
MFRSFTDMPVWQNAHTFSLEIFHLSSELPISEDYGLTSQIRRSANGVWAYIAEAFGRKTNKVKSHCYIMARGSLFETQNNLIYGLDVDYFKNEIKEDLLNRYSDLIYEINKINSSFLA